MTLSTACPYDDDGCMEKQDTAASLRTYKRSHGEISVGYLGMWSDETNRALELKSADGDASIAGRVTEPFLGKPYAASILTGPTFETRAVISRARFTLGARFPFATFRPSDTVSRLEIAGEQREVLVRSMKVWDLRTGIGFELPIGERVAGFVDVLGDVQFMTTQLMIDGQRATYTGTNFAFGVRAGARVQVNHLFFQLAAETSLLGGTRYGGTFMAGIAF